MCLRFQFCTHQRVCILHFLKKSQIRCTLLSIRGTKFLWWAIQNFFFFKIFTLVLLDGFLDGFWKFRLLIVKICILIGIFEYFSKIIAFYRMLSILGTNFIAHWAYDERISAHAQPAVKCEQFLHVQYMLSIRGTNFDAHWAYAERISSHAEHTRNRFHRMLSMRRNVKVEYLGRIEYDFQKSRVTGPWDHMASVSAKKV